MFKKCLKSRKYGPTFTAPAKKKEKRSDQGKKKSKENKTWER